MKKVLACSLALLLSTQGAASAADLFSVAVTSGGTTQSKAFDNISDFATANFATINTVTYTPTSAASASLFIRGIEARSSYALNQTALTFDVGTLGIHQVFNGATRADSQKLFEDWLKSNAGSLLKAFTEHTAIDPIAGNPNSLMNKMAANDFSMASGLTGSGNPGTSAEGGPVVVGLEAEYGQFKSGDFKGSSYQLPISTSIPLTNNGTELLLSLPIQYTEVEGAASYATGFGAGLRVPVSKYWSLTPAARAGVAGSSDLGAGSVLYSGSLTSTLGNTFSGFDVKMGNMVSYYQSQGIKIGDINLDYDLTNVAFVNGIGASHELPFTLFNNKLNGQMFVTNTWFTGSPLYIANYTDIGAAVNMPVTVLGKTFDKLSLGTTFSVGEHYTAVRANFGFKF